MAEHLPQEWGVFDAQAAITAKTVELARGVEDERTRLAAYT